VEGAHFHQGRLLEPLANLKGEFRAVVPAVLCAAEDVFAIQGVEIDHVETARVVRLGRFGGHFGQERGFRIGHEQPEALFEMVHLRPLGMPGDFRPAGPAHTAGERVRGLLGDALVGDQLVVDLQGHAIAHEKTGHRRHGGGRFDHRDRLGLSRQIFGQRERGVLGQPWVGNRRDPGAGLGDEERIGVQPGGNPGGVQLVDHGFQAFESLGVRLRVGLAVAEPERRAAVKIDLVHAQALGQLDPVVDLFFRHIAEVEQV